MIKVRDVTRRDVERLHRSMKDKPFAANRCFAVLGALMQFAVKHEVRGDNPCRGGTIARFPEERRKRYLSQVELAKVAAVLVVWPDQTAADAIRLAMLTGARRSEVQRAKFEQFDFERGIWVKDASATKQRREHRVPLSAPARQLVAEVKDRQPDSPWLFPSRVPDQPIRHLSQVWRQVANAAGIENARLHDLRHSFASILASSGASLSLIGSMLGHSSPTTTHRYSHLFDSAEREAAEQVGRFVAGAAIGSAAHVVPLRPKAK